MSIDVVNGGDGGLTETPIDVAVAVDRQLAHAAFATGGFNVPRGVWFSPQLIDRTASIGAPRSGYTMEACGAPERLSVTIRSVCEPSGAERAVASADVPLESVYAGRNRATAAWGAAALMLGALERARADRPLPDTAGADKPRALTPSSEGDEGSITPGFTALPRRFARVRRAAEAARRRPVSRRQWLLAYHFGTSGALTPTNDTRLVVPPPDRYWADPHVAIVSGDYHVFFEEFVFSEGKGHIATMRLGKAGPQDVSRVALSVEHHLSYPFTFEFEGDWYMIPECAQSGRIDLHRADDFPLRWTPVKTLMDAVSAVDTTLVEHEGRWWLFATIRKLSGTTPVSNLYLFSAGSPLSQEWEPHPLNPIVSGSAGARCAGGFIRNGDRLVRPAQDARSSYGSGIQLSEIVRMTRNEYRERPAGALEPNRSSGFIGLHTLTKRGDLTMVDLCRWRTRS